MAGLSDLAGKVVVITGATTGIGEATAIEFAKLGSKLVITGRNSQGLEDTKAKCVQQGLAELDVAIVIGDLCDEKTLDSISETALQNFGKVDVLFLSAGKLHPKDGPVTQTDSTEALDLLYKTLIKSPYKLTQKLSAELIKTKGVIVINSGFLSEGLLFPLATAFSIFKAAQDQMTRLFALTFANKGVRVNAVRPGAVRTSVFSESIPDKNQVDGLLALLASHTPLGETLTGAEEVARTVVFLASYQSACITGTLLSADRGLTMTHPAVDWRHPISQPVSLGPYSQQTGASQ